MSHSRMLMILSFVLFLLATLTAGGVISASLPWLVPGGLAAMALSFIL